MFTTLILLAVELASQFFFGRGLAAQGAVLLKQAIDKYEQWGATAKVKILKPRYLGFMMPQHPTVPSFQRLLFPPTIHSTQPQKKVGSIQLNQNQPRPLSLSFSSTADSAKIDVVSVVQASQLVSQEMQLDKMLQKFIRILVHIYFFSTSSVSFSFLVFYNTILLPQRHCYGKCWCRPSRFVVA